MRAYAEGVGAVFRYPCVCGKTRIHKINHLVVYGKAFKANFRRYDGIAVRRFVDRAVCHGGKLYAVFFIKNNALYGIGELRASDTVQHYVSDGYLPCKDLALRLG